MDTVTTTYMNRIGVKAEPVCAGLRTSHFGRLRLLQAVLAIACLGAAGPRLGNDPDIIARWPLRWLRAARDQTVRLATDLARAGRRPPTLIGQARHG